MVSHRVESAVLICNHTHLAVAASLPPPTRCYTHASAVVSHLVDAPTRLTRHVALPTSSFLSPLAMLPVSHGAPARPAHRFSRLVIVAASLCALLVLVGLRSLIGAGAPSPSTFGFLPSSHSAPAVDVESLLQQRPDDGEYDYSLETGKGWRTLGTPAQAVVINSSLFIDSRTGKTHEWNVPSAYNLAVLKLPAGAKWDLLGVIRGPTNVLRNFQINGQNWQERSLVGIGLRITADGGLEPVTLGYMLDLPSQPKDGCAFSGIWAGTFGPEDARLFWTDAGTPGMTFGRLSMSPNTCRSIGFVADLRNIFPELVDALSTARLPPFRPALAAEGVQREIVRRQESVVEKNWQAFYPGVVPGGQTVPHIHYSINPVLPLAPAEDTGLQIVYDDLQLDNNDDQLCIGRLQNPNGRWHLHEATPLHRLTLCERGCVPSVHNTVLMSLNHAIAFPRYIRWVVTSGYADRSFIVLHNATAPFNAISAGPRFHYNNREDVRPHYTLAMVPITEGDLGDDPALDGGETDYPGHFFLDDKVMITFGTLDERMSVIVIPVVDLLQGHKLCKDGLAEAEAYQAAQEEA